MSEQMVGIPPELDAITRAIEKGVRDALREHALMGRNVCIWRDGKIVHLSPPEIFAELKKQEESNGHYDDDDE